LVDLVETSLSRLVRRRCHALEKTLSKWIVRQSPATDLLGELQQLWHEVQIGRFSEEGCQVAELFVGLNLLQVGLRALLTSRRKRNASSRFDLPEALGPSK
jgi:hypothetical protein